MTAGASATQWPNGVVGSPLISVDPSLPFQPRLLSPKERSKTDLYVFYSPRNRRVTSITEALNFALGLQLEFDPDITAYVERPYRLILSPRRHVDISFWTRRRSGEERFRLTIPSSATVGIAGGEFAARERDVLNQAAARQGLKVDHVFESELVRCGEQISTYFRLLPYVQSVRRIAGRATIRDGIYAHLSSIERATFRQLHHILCQHDPRHLTAVAASMIHEGEIRLTDDRGLSPDSFLELEVSHGAH